MVTRLSDSIQDDNIMELEALLHKGEFDEMVLVCGLMHAAQVGSFNALRVLIDYGLDVNSHDIMFDETALMKATRQGNVRIMNYLVNVGCDINHRAEPSGEAAVHIAAKNNELESLNFLLSQKSFSIDITDKHGMTALMQAIIFADTKVARTLIQAGCNLLCFSQGGLAAIHHALKPCWQTAGHLGSGDAANLQVLLEAGVSPDMLDEYGTSPLHHAIIFNSVKAIKILLIANCDINKRNNVRPREIPFEQALRKVNFRVAKLLYISGCNINMKLLRILDDLKVNDCSAQLGKWLHKILSEPRSLKDCCRICIRRKLGYLPQKAIDSLFIPDLLKDFLKLTELFEH